MVLNLAKDALGDDGFTIGHGRRRRLQRLGNREIDVVRHRSVFHSDGQAQVSAAARHVAHGRSDRPFRNKTC